MERTNNNSSDGMDKVSHWLKQIDRIIKRVKYKSRKESLKDIRNTIAETDNVTDDQVRAIKNLQNGKNAITN